jgi:hypothetical protein
MESCWISSFEDQVLGEILLLDTEFIELGHGKKRNKAARKMHFGTGGK